MAPQRRRSTGDIPIQPPIQCAIRSQSCSQAGSRSGSRAGSLGPSPPSSPRYPDDNVDVRSQHSSPRSTCPSLPPVSDPPSQRLVKVVQRLKQQRSSSVPSLPRASMPAAKPLPSLPKVQPKARDSEEKKKAQKAVQGFLDTSDPEQVLLRAAVTNDVNMIKVLAVMDRKALLKHVDYALLYAIRAGSSDCVKTMFKYGASAKAKDAFGHSMWDYAKKSPDPEAMCTVLESATGHTGASEDIRVHFSGHVGQERTKEGSAKSKDKKGYAEQSRGAISEFTPQERSAQSPSPTTTIPSSKSGSSEPIGPGKNGTTLGPIIRRSMGGNGSKAFGKRATL